MSTDNPNDLTLTLTRESVCAVLSSVKFVYMAQLPEGQQAYLSDDKLPIQQPHMLIDNGNYHSMHFLCSGVCREIAQCNGLRHLNSCRSL